MRLFIKLFVKFRSQITKISLRFKSYESPQDFPASKMDKEMILNKIAEVPFWWHHIDLGYGITTLGHHGDIKHPSGDRNMLENMQLQEDLRGKTILDIGAWDGFYSFEAEKRGASRVLAIDNFYRGKMDGEKVGNQGFEVAKEILSSKVEFKKASVYDLNPTDFGMFDIVFFFGVFYHVKYPLLALEKIYSVCKKEIIIETHYESCYFKWEKPIAVFYENDEVHKDITNWWGFNESGLISILRTVGFKNIKVVHRYADRIIIKAEK